MRVKIRPVNNGWHPGYEFEWQPTSNFNDKWYGVFSKNIWPDPDGDAESRRQAALETHYIMNALYQNVPVQVHARYDRQTHRLFIMKAG